MQAGETLLERVTPERNLEYDLELWRRGEEEREAERGRGICPTRCGAEKQHTRSRSL